MRENKTPAGKSQIKIEMACPQIKYSVFRYLSNFGDNYFPGMPGNHEFFIGFHHPYGNRLVFYGNNRSILLIQIFIQINAQITQLVAYSLANLRAFSPMPPVKIRISIPPRAAARAPRYFLAW
jgi:hypothetical protein